MTPFITKRVGYDHSAASHTVLSMLLHLDPLHTYGIYMPSLVLIYLQQNVHMHPQNLYFELKIGYCRRETATGLLLITLANCRGIS